MRECNEGTEDVASIPEAATHPDLTPLLYNWRRVAAVAWEGMLTRGRGFVNIDVSGSETVYTYRPGVPCEHFRELIEGYDPEREVLLCIDHGPEVADGLVRIGGWPTPPEAFATLGVEEMGGTLQ